MFCLIAIGHNGQLTIILMEVDNFWIINNTYISWTNLWGLEMINEHVHAILLYYIYIYIYI